MHNNHFRRSLLYVPASNEKMCRKALAFDCDAIIFDLEDAVSPGAKECAREFLCAFLNEERGTKEMVVRVNQVSTRTGLLDLMAIVPCKPDTLIIPKACPPDIVTADRIITALEDAYAIPAGSIGLIPLIETAMGLESLSEILATAKRINGVQLGAEDLTKELDIVRTPKGLEIAYARCKMLMAARAYGLDAIDTPYADYTDLAGLSEDIATIVAIGMTAKTAIHPNQIAPINMAFTPTRTAIEEAANIVSAFTAALEAGKGAFSLNGKMVDAPVALRAQKILDKAARLGLDGV